MQVNAGFVDHGQANKSYQRASEQDSRMASPTLRLLGSMDRADRSAPSSRALCMVLGKEVRGPSMTATRKRALDLVAASPRVDAADFDLQVSGHLVTRPQLGCVHGLPAV